MPARNRARPKESPTRGLHQQRIIAQSSTGLNVDASDTDNNAPIFNNASDGIRLIAFLLPQFHPIPENDHWWGKGFTEWSSVVSARPYFKEHKQPALPADLGFYDLRLAEARQAQADLAREHGISGFCYYYYWFSGRRILERPLEEISRTKEPDFPFCVCWANEPWTRRWDGSEKEVLVMQDHDSGIDRNFIIDIMHLLKDERYICIGDAPLILVYRVSLIPSPVSLFDQWRELAQENGIASLHICMAETFGIENPYLYGCDSSVEFPPHGLWASVINADIDDLAEGFAGSVYDYREVVRAEVQKPLPDYLRFRTVMPSWDNTPRRGSAGNVFAHSSPVDYEVWLREVVRQAKLRSNPDERLVFINAWNEWGEGAHLEPDRHHGRGYLEATRRALADQSDWKLSLRHLDIHLNEADRQVRDLIEALRHRFLSFEMSNRFLASQLELQGGTIERVSFKPGLLFQNLSFTDEKAVGNLDQIGRHGSNTMPVLQRDYPVFFRGWCFAPGVTLLPSSLGFITLHADDASCIYSCPIMAREERLDVVEHFSAPPEITRWAGFSLKAELSAVKPGCYRLGIGLVLDKYVTRTMVEASIVVI